MKRRRPSPAADIAAAQAVALVRELTELNAAAASLLADLSESLDTPPKDRNR